MTTEATPSDLATTLPILTLISDHLDRQAAERPGQDFLVLGDTRLTYGEAKRRVDVAARALMAAGVEVGDRVAMLSAPRPEFFLHFLAVTRIGGIWLGLNPKYTEGELEHVLADAEPSLVFAFAVAAGDSQLDKLNALVSGHESVHQLIMFDDPEASPGAVDWLDFVDEADEVSVEQLAERRAAVDAFDAAFLVYTSGSTGRPKGALTSHRASNICNVIGVEWKGLSDRTIICNLPINDVGAIGDICARTLTGGGALHFQEQFAPVEMMEIIESGQLNTIGGVPTMLQMCANHPEFDRFDLTSIDLIAWGGAAMPAELLATLMDKADCQRATMGTE